jgi:DNA (cytosine-5)-methyltransferase 1
MEGGSVKVLDLFSGILGFGLACERAGVEHLAFVEIDADCQRVIRRHSPDVPIINDVKEVTKERYTFKPDAIFAGVPCQGFSVAGLRAGLADERSGLWFETRRVIEEYRPRWVVIENVPGLLSGCGCLACQAVGRITRIHAWIRKRQGGKSCAVCVAGKRMLASHSGRNFAIILQGLAECGYVGAWRIFDSQYDGVAQRRNRVFIVAGLGAAGERAAEILFESTGGCWDSPPRREERQGIAGTVRSGAAGRSAGAQQNANGLPGNIVCGRHGDTVGTLQEKDGRGAHSDVQIIAQEVVGTLNSGGNNGGFRTEPGEHLIAQTITAHQFRGNGATAGDNGKPVNLQVVPIDMRQASRGEKFTNNRASGSGGAPGVGIGNEGDPAFTVTERAQVVAITPEVIPFDTTQITSRENGCNPQPGAPCHPLASGAHAPAIAYNIQQNDGGAHRRKDRPNGGMYVKETDTALTVGSTDQTVVAFTERTRADGRNFEAQEELAYALTNPGSGGRTHSRQIAGAFGVRRLMPVECEALQGFPRDWTRWDEHGKEISDSARYRLLGNAVCVATAEWIARRLVAVDRELQEATA